MAFQSFERPENHGHLLGDVPALLIVAVVLVILTPKENAHEVFNVLWHTDNGIRATVAG